MDRKKIPTAPGERAKRAQMLNGKTLKKRRTLGLLILVMFVSFIVGFSGSLMARSYPANWPLAESLIISDSVTPEIVFVDSDRDSSSTAVMTVLQARQSKTIATIFPVTSAEFSEPEELGKAVIISTDGWLVALAEVVGNRTSVAIVLSDGKLFVTDELISDAYSDVVFIKIDASQLPVIDFRTDPIKLGEPLIFYTLAINSGDRVSFGQIENTGFHSDNIFSTAKPNLLYLTDHASRDEYLGSPVFDRSGAMIGLNMLDHLILPVDEISRHVYDIFSKDEIELHSILIDYKPLYRTVDTDTGFRKRGVEIITLGSLIPGLKIGDIILAVDDVNLDIDSDLSDILANVTLGDNVVFKISRAGIQSEVTVTIE